MTLDSLHSLEQLRARQLALMKEDIAWRDAKKTKATAMAIAKMKAKTEAETLMVSKSDVPCHDLECGHERSNGPSEESSEHNGGSDGARISSDHKRSYLSHPLANDHGWGRRSGRGVTGKPSPLFIDSHNHLPSRSQHHSSDRLQDHLHESVLEYVEEAEEEEEGNRYQEEEEEEEEDDDDDVRNYIISREHRGNLMRS